MINGTVTNNMWTLYILYISSSRSYHYCT